METIESLGLFPIVLEFFQVKQKRLNQHSIKIIRNVVDSRSFTYQSIIQYQIIDNTLEILEDMMEQGHDWCVDVLVQVLYALVDRTQEAYDDTFADREVKVQVEKLIEGLYLCFELL